ncbi:hypothetical protein D3C76_1127700 [compost metagenome]
MVATTGITFIRAMNITSTMCFQLWRKASLIGDLATLSCFSSFTNAGVSCTSLRMMKPAISTMALIRNGMRQPQSLKASLGMK